MVSSRCPVIPFLSRKSKSGQGKVRWADLKIKRLGKGMWRSGYRTTRRYAEDSDETLAAHAEAAYLVAHPGVFRGRRRGVEASGVNTEATAGGGGGARWLLADKGGKGHKKEGKEQVDKEEENEAWDCQAVGYYVMPLAPQLSTPRSGACHHCIEALLLYHRCAVDVLPDVLNLFIIMYYTLEEVGYCRV